MVSSLLKGDSDTLSRKLNESVGMGMRRSRDQKKRAGSPAEGLRGAGYRRLAQGQEPQGTHEVGICAMLLQASLSSCLSTGPAPSAPLIGVCSSHQGNPNPCTPMVMEVPPPVLSEA
jgi:hypothetical protein